MSLTKDQLFNSGGEFATSISGDAARGFASAASPRPSPQDPCAGRGASVSGQNRRVWRSPTSPAECSGSCGRDSRDHNGPWSRSDGGNSPQMPSSRAKRAVALAAGRALRLSQRDPFSAIYNGIASYAQFIGRNHQEAIRLAREGIRLRSDFVDAHRVLTAAAAWWVRTRSARLRCRNFVGCGPTSHWTGSQPNCRSSRKPTGNTI
jgi:hypothetical protein